MAAAALVSCATAKRAGGPEGFPLDPRQELAGPFPASVEKGWAALLAGETARAEAAFDQARREKGGMAADIGRIETIVLAGRPGDALASCDNLMASGEPTGALLVACGEARARSGDVVQAFGLYRRAIARLPGRPLLDERTQALKAGARDEMIALARSAIEEKKIREARTYANRALEIAPENPVSHTVAAEADLAAGDKDKALKRYREAIALGASDREVSRRAGDLALELNDYAFAVSVFDGLAREDAQFAPLAEEARLAFRVANWPAAEREAARAARLTRAAAATLAWWMCPEIRETRVSNGVIASDAVSRKDSRALTRAVALGLLDVDRDTHRASPDAPLTSAAAARMLLRLLVLIAPASRDLDCLPEGRLLPRSAGEALESAQTCGLLPAGELSGVGGRVFTGALDRIRALASGTEATDE